MEQAGLELALTLLLLPLSVGAPGDATTLRPDFNIRLYLLLDIEPSTL